MGKQLEAGKFGVIILGCAFGLLALGSAQEITKRYFNLSELGDIPGVVQVSTDYLTIIEFEGHAVEEASTARGDLYVLEISDNIIRIRANEEVVNTDLYARVAGQTVLFKLESDATTESPRRYVVRDVEPPQRGIQRSNGSSGAPRPDRPTDAEAPLFPKGLLFETDLFRPRQSEIIIQYRLINESEHPIVNDPFRLRVYYGDTSIRYVRTSSPVAGRPNFLAPGEAEYGQIVVPQAPADLDRLELEWQLIEVGPGTQHTLVRNFAEMAEGPAGALDQATRLPNPASGNVAEAPVAEALADEQPTEPEPAPQVTNESSDNVSSNNESSDNESAGAAADPATDTTNASVLIDSSFEGDSSDPWKPLTYEGGQATGTVTSGEYCTDVTNSGETFWHVSLLHEGLTLNPDHAYTLSLDAYADKPVNLIYDLSLAREPYTSYFYRNVPLDTSRVTFEHPFTLEGSVDGEVRLVFFMGQVDSANVAPYTVCLDDIRLVDLGPKEGAAASDPATEEVAPATASERAPLVRSDFGQGVENPWDVSIDSAAEASVDYEAGEACINVKNGGSEPWHVFAGWHELPLEQGKTYEFSFDGYADKPLGIIPLISLGEVPYTAHFQSYETLVQSKTEYRYTFDMQEDDPTARLVFVIGGAENAQAEPYRMCLSNIELLEVGTPPVDSAPSDAASGELGSDVLEADASWFLWTDTAARANRNDEEGEVCVTVGAGGSDIADVIVGQNGVLLKPGVYTLRFNAYSDKHAGIVALFELKDKPGTDYHQKYEALTPAKRSYVQSFEVPADAPVGGRDGRLNFLLGGEQNASYLPYRVCLSDVELLAGGA